MKDLIDMGSDWKKYRVKNYRDDDYDQAFDYLSSHTPREKDICKHFGCGRELDWIESLYGDRCFYHQKKVPVSEARGIGSEPATRQNFNNGE
jgi:hypothetical protein